MLGRERLIRTLLIWAVLTAFIVLGFLGALALANYNRINDISGQTCGTVGGRWTETTYQFICVVDKEWQQ